MHKMAYTEAKNAFQTFESYTSILIHESASRRNRQPNIHVWRCFFSNFSRGISTTRNFSYKEAVLDSCLAVAMYLPLSQQAVRDSSLDDPCFRRKARWRLRH